VREWVVEGGGSMADGWLRQICHGVSSLVFAKVVMIPVFTTGSTRNRRRMESELKFLE
jgi:hypothetical protein